MAVKKAPEAKKAAVKKPATKKPGIKLEKKLSSVPAKKSAKTSATKAAGAKADKASLAATKSKPGPKKAAMPEKKTAPLAKRPAAAVKEKAPAKKKAALPVKKNVSGAKKPGAKAQTALPSAKAAPGRKKAAATKPSLRIGKKSALSPLQVSLVARLSDAVPLLDDECLAALVQSAENLAESCRQERMLADAQALAQQLGGALKPAGKSGRKKSAKEADANPVPATRALPGPLTVEASEDGRFFHIVVDNKWKMLDRDELKHLVAIATSPDPEPELRNRMFRWLKKERSDALIDLGISSALSPILEELVVYLKTHFRVKK